MSQFLYILHWALMIAFAGCAVWIAFGRPHPIARLYLAAILLLQVLYNGCILTAIQNYFWQEEGLAPVEVNLLTAKVSHDPMWLFLSRALFLGVALWQIKIVMDERNKGKLDNEH